MKKLLLILFIVCTVQLIQSKPTEINSQNSEYCDGWHDGYIEGYCYDTDYGCLEPLVPLCPLPYINKDTYNDGYNRGFIRGRNDSK